MTVRLVLMCIALSLGTGQPCPSAASTLRGRVLDARTGAPVPKAHVYISLGEKDETTQRTLTDAQGRFEFRGLAPGRYSVNVWKDGFLSVTYGERPPIRDKTLVEVGEGADVSGIDIVLERSCAISGRVVDEFGEPVSRAAVIAEMRYEGEDGTPRRLNSETATNDLGQFRMVGLKPGKYFIVAEPPALVRVSDDAIEDQEPAKDTPIYYPGTADPAAAAPVRLRPGQDFEVTIALGPRVRTALLSGIVVDGQGRPLEPGASVLVSGFSPSRGLLAYVPVRQGGTFTVSGLIPGNHSLSVTLRDPDGRPPEWGLSRATVSDGDVSGVVVRTSRGATVSGRVVFEGAATPPAGNVDVHVYEVGEDPSDLSSRLTTVGGDGTFTLTPLFGECLIRVSDMPGWMLKAVTVKGRDFTDTPITFDGGETISGATIVFTDRVTHVNVAVLARDGRPADTSYLVISPDDPAKWQRYGWRHRRKAWVHDANPVRFDALPPGDYFAFALNASAALEDTDESRLAVAERMRKIATKFSLREGETKDLVVKPVGLDGK